MIDISVLPSIVGRLQVVLLHGQAVSSLIPGWLVLIVAVLGLWIVIAVGVLVVDRLLRRFVGRQ